MELSKHIKDCIKNDLLYEINNHQLFPYEHNFCFMQANYLEDNQILLYSLRKIPDSIIGKVVEKYDLNYIGWKYYSHPKFKYAYLLERKGDNT